MGEITVTNWTHLHLFHRDAVKGNVVLDGLTNYNLYGAMFLGFCGSRTDTQSGGYNRTGNDRVALDPPDLSSLAAVMVEQATYESEFDLDRLASFLDTHDEARIARRCNDALRVRNALAFLLTYRGIPVVYYGTEQGWDMQDNREALWSSKFDQSSAEYVLIAALNRARKAAHLGAATVLRADGNVLIFERLARGSSVSSGSSVGAGSSGSQAQSADGLPIMITLVNNLPESAAESELVYCTQGLTLPPRAPMGECWMDALTGVVAVADAAGCFHARDAEPKVLVRRACADVLAAGAAALEFSGGRRATLL